MNPDPARNIIERKILLFAAAPGVWKALTDPEILKCWLFDTEINVISDWKTGSPIIFKGKLHGTRFEDRGTILEFVPEKVFQYTYLSWISGLADRPENYTVIEFKLEPQNSQTLLTLTQTGFLAKASYEHWNFYWNATLDILKKLVENKGIGDRK
jgi:uncharacterized protein YndB with AHSA1/START domain